MDYTSEPPVVIYEYNNKEDIVIHTKHSDTDKEPIFLHMKKDVSNKPYLHMQSTDFEKIRYKYRNSFEIIQHHTLSRELKDKIDVCLLAIRTKRINKSSRTERHQRSVIYTHTENNKKIQSQELFIVNFYIHHYDGSVTEHEKKFFPDNRGVNSKLHVNVYLPKPIEIIKYPTKKAFLLFQPSTWFN